MTEPERKTNFLVWEKGQGREQMQILTPWEYTPPGYPKGRPYRPDPRRAVTRFLQAKGYLHPDDPKGGPESWPVGMQVGIWDNLEGGRTYEVVNPAITYTRPPIEGGKPWPRMVARPEGSPGGKRYEDGLRLVQPQEEEQA